MDATLAWTVVGSGAGVAAVGVAIVVAVSQARSGRRIRSKVTAELGYGQLGEDGVLCVELASGKTNVTFVPKSDESRTSARPKRRKKPQQEIVTKPVITISIRNLGRMAITVSRCHYEANLEGIGFSFEPQPAASPRGDHLPIRLEADEDALLIHDFVTMRVFLNHVLRDHEVSTAVFQVVLTLGHGAEIMAAPSLRVQANMTDEEIAVVGVKLVRQGMNLESPYLGPLTFERRRWRRGRPDI